MRNVGDRIRRGRRIKGWTQARLASSLGVTTSAVGHWERPDGHHPSSENLVEIAKHLSVSVEWLAIGCGDMRAHGSCGSLQSVISLSAEEEMLIKRYQGLSSPSRALLVQFIEALTNSAESTVKAGVARASRESKPSLRPSSIASLITPT